MKYYLTEIEKVYEELGSGENGLTAKEASERLERNGRNKLEDAPKKPLIKRFLEQLADPMIIILIVAAVISAVTSVVENEFPTDVIIIMAVVIINAILGVYQESKAEKAIEALQKMSAATSKVMRDGNLTVVKSEELVKGDVIILEAGDAVPADARIFESASLKIEEAALTGESVPVDKIVRTLMLRKETNDVPLGDRRNMVYMGSTVVYGRGKAVVTDTGMDTEMGHIAGALAQAEESKTPLQQKLAGLSKILSIVVLGICAFIFVFGIGRQFITGGKHDLPFFLETFMLAVSLAVAAIPEGLVAVVTVVLSIGVTNMSKRNAIIRKLTAVETLGCTQIICSDKTGTLTQNKMTVVDSYGYSKDDIASFMALCTDCTVDSEGNVQGEPTEAALVNFALKLGKDMHVLAKERPRVSEIPFDSMRKMMSTIHNVNGEIFQYTKGAPDEILCRCKFYQDPETGIVRDMTIAEANKITEANKAFADRALRVLAISYRILDSVPEGTPDSKTYEKDLVFVGLVGMIDPGRPEVKAAITECREAGIRPVMITGDHKDTAVAIAKELGIIEDASQAITGAQLNDIPDDVFAEDVVKYSVYARVQPEHKTRIVNAWKKRGMITAMTGDGVNDAPSIKSADIGVGMGITGTDVTKNVADMVLADDNFATIVTAVEEGRRIYDNIRKAIQFLLGSNFSEVAAIFIANLFGFTILRPVHLLWINLVTDCFPALALSGEKAEKNVMKRPPRKSKDGIFAGGMGKDVIYQGIVVTLLVLASYFTGAFLTGASFGNLQSETGITMAFVTMAMCEIFHSLNMRSPRASTVKMTLEGNHNKYLLMSTVGSLIITTLVLYVPFLRKAFGFASLSICYYLIAIGIAVLIIPVVELVKFFQRKKEQNK